MKVLFTILFSTIILVGCTKGSDSFVSTQGVLINSEDNTVHLVHGQCSSLTSSECKEILLEDYPEYLENYVHCHAGDKWQPYDCSCAIYDKNDFVERVELKNTIIDGYLRRDAKPVDFKNFDLTDAAWNKYCQK